MERGKYVSDFERRLIVRADASVTKNAQLAAVSIGTVTNVTSAFRSMGKTSVNMVGNCSQQCTFYDRDAHALARYVKKNRGTASPQVTEDVKAEQDPSVSARTACRQLHREGYYSRFEMHKPLITKMNAHLRVQWCKNHTHWSTEMWKRGIWSDESSFTIFSTSERVPVWRTPREQVGSDCLTPTVRGSGGSVMLWGAFCRHGLDPFIPLAGRVTANQYKVVLSDHPCPKMKHFYPDGSGLFHIEHEGSLNGLMSMKIM